MRPRVLMKQVQRGRVVRGLRFRISAEVGRFFSGRSPGSEVAILPTATPSPATTEWEYDAAILVYSGGTAPVLHRLPFSGLAAT